MVNVEYFKLINLDGEMLLKLDVNLFILTDRLDQNYSNFFFSVKKILNDTKLKQNYALAATRFIEN